jgi:hypothetical protein
MHHFYDHTYIFRARIVTVQHVYHALGVSPRDAVPTLEPLHKRRPRFLVIVNEIITRVHWGTYIKVVTERSSRSPRCSRRCAVRVDEMTRSRYRCCC